MSANTFTTVLQKNYGELLDYQQEREKSRRANTCILFTFGMEHFEMVYGHLENLGLFKLGRALLLKCCGDESSKLCQAIVDPVPSPLLDYPTPLLSTDAGPCVRARRCHTAAMHNHNRIKRDEHRFTHHCYIILT